MPLSFRRSFKKLPTASINKRKRPIRDAARGKTVRPSEEFRPTKYPLLIPVGCGAAVGLCLFLVFSRGLLRWPTRTAAPGIDYASLATSALETALADQLTTVAAQLPTDTAPIMPTLTSSATAVPSLTATLVPTLPPTPGPARNPWAADIPDAACIPADLPQTGRVVEVVDGDTIKVLLDDDGHVYSVRYIGADAPQVSDGIGNPGLEAMARNIELVYRKQAIMVRDISDSDGSGTLLRYVMADGVFANMALVAEGMAKADSTPPDTACLGSLSAAEERARAGGLGMWRTQSTGTQTSP